MLRKIKDKGVNTKTGKSYMKREASQLVKFKRVLNSDIKQLVNKMSPFIFLARVENQI